jgi:hypothetical protein
MTPVVEAIWRDLKATGLVHTDGTGLPVRTKRWPWAIRFLIMGAPVVG